MTIAAREPQRATAAPADRCRVPQAFWRVLAHLGLRPAAVLRQARLPVTLHLSQTVVTTAQFFGIFKAVEALARDPGFSLKIVHAADAAGHQPAFIAACYAADFRDAIARVDRFKRLGSAELFHFEEKHGEFSVRKEWPHATEPEPAMLTEMTFAYLLALGRRGTAHHVTPIRVDIERSGAETPALSAYFGCPIHYGAVRSALVLRSVDLDRPFPGHNAEFLDMLAPALAAAVKDVDAPSSVAEQVKTVLKRILASGRPEIADVARDLGLSERTLQRRITDEGTTFRALLAAARQDLGRQLLSDPAMEVDAVAFLLGYQDTSSFYRAFRTLEGVTPAHWRGANNARREPARVH